MNVGVINYGMGNIDSVCRAVEHIGYDVDIITRSSELEAVSHIILPGVGTYSAAMDHLNQSGLLEAIKYQVIEANKPILGICLGMQILSDVGEEVHLTKGLGLIPGKVIKLKSSTNEEKIPHVGWNEVRHQDDGLFSEIISGKDFYFVHSYHFISSKPENIVATTPYCGETVTAIRSGHVYGVQFHPEKSQKNGLKLIQNFLES